MTEEEVLLQLKTNFSIPSGIEIIKSAMAELLGKNSSKEYIKENFSFLIEEVQRKAYKNYLELERPAAASAFKNTFEEILPKCPQKADFFKLIQDNFWAIDKFFLSLTQGRKPRAGSAFEYAIKALFDLLEYPYSAQPVINGKPDFLLPSKDHYISNAIDCLIFTVKRTLRERWRQITTEGTRGHLFFLATIDGTKTANDISEMLSNRIYLVVPQNIKENHYSEFENVISFEVFFDQHLDPAMERWRKNGIIE